MVSSLPTFSAKNEANTVQANTSWPTPRHQTACHENSSATVTEERGAPRKVEWKRKHDQVKL